MIKVKLKDVVDIYNGSTPSTKEKGNFNGNIPWITPKDLSIQKSKYIKYGERNITSQGLKKIGGKLLPKGTLVFSSRAPIGLIGISKVEISTNQGFKNMVCRENMIVNEYLYYVLKIQICKINELGTGTTFKEVSKKAIEEFEIYIENNIEKQQKIASVLSALDDKIELNNKINAELEAMAKMIYDYWFVQFDFPDENGKPYKSSGGKMVYSPELKKEIPEGWEVKKFGNVFIVSRGTMITKEMTTEGNYKVVAAGLNYSYLNGSYNREKYTVTISGSGANAGYVNFWTEKIFASDCTTVRSHDDIEIFLGLQFLKLYQEYIFSLAKGSAQPHVYPNDITELNYICMPKFLQNNYGSLALDIYKKISTNNEEIQKLTNLRDWLLPMLMNGQVKVS